MDVLGSIRGLLKVDDLSIDNKIFRLHYKATMFILVAFSLLVTQKQYFGDPISCYVNENNVATSIMDTYCWIHSTYTVLGGDNPGVHPGVKASPNQMPNIGAEDRGGPEEKGVIRYHTYYQWVTLFLWIQAVIFYAPRYMWKAIEGGKIKTLVMQLNTPIVDENLCQQRKQMLVSYFKKNVHKHNSYAIKFFICEVFNFINIIVQICITDSFLGNQFSNYGSRVMSFNKMLSQIDESDRELMVSPMDEIFPKVSKCHMSTYGASGSVQKNDGLCVLSMNIFNEKVFFFLWFWYIGLAVVSGFAILYRCATLSCVFRKWLLKVKSRLSKPEDIELISEKFGFGDWFILYLIAKNMDPLIYKDFITDLAENLKT